ncbi:chloride intracellular channel protein 1 [Biomphalaria pfeifferi]|uniref:Chloride intracellular channel protein 1 n=1 Tax=Biomphalaria pfeifferi TaxID=112525 RepID=A0AAD8FFJ1_BIOPF|nr:chloride intracellular channel protein 1 [Biomphalaria pfeifferi]
MSKSSNHVQLYVRAGWDGTGYGACPFCQRFYMVLDLKAKGHALTYDIISVNTARPPPEFRKFANRLPVLKHDDEVIMDTEEIQQYLDVHFPKPDLRYTNRDAHTACLDVFSKFSFFIKNVSHTPDHLLKELSYLDSYLDRTGNKFMCGDELTNLDCNVLPKLQHIRVASKAFKDFEIPGSMTYLWGYLANAYKNDTFKKTCPSDQEIVHHWSEKKETTPLPESKQKLYMVESTPRFSLDIPAFANGHYRK